MPLVCNPIFFFCDTLFVGFCIFWLNLSLHYSIQRVDLFLHDLEFVTNIIVSSLTRSSLGELFKFSGTNSFPFQYQSAPSAEPSNFAPLALASYTCTAGNIFCDRQNKRFYNNLFLSDSSSFLRNLILCVDLSKYLQRYQGP